MSCRYSGSRADVYIVVVACGLLLIVQCQIERCERRITQMMKDAQCRCKANEMKEAVNTDANREKTR